mgnify:CR=1 FL=1
MPAVAMEKGILDASHSVRVERLRPLEAFVVTAVSFSRAAMR